MESNAEKIKLLRSNAHNYACLISSVKELTHLRGLVTFHYLKFLLLPLDYYYYYYYIV